MLVKGAAGGGNGGFSSAQYLFENIYPIWVMTTNNCVKILRPRVKGHHFPDDIFIGIFVNKKMYKFWLSFIEICSKGPNKHHSSIGSDNGFAPSRCQAIIWTNDTKFIDAYMRHLVWMS